MLVSMSRAPGSKPSTVGHRRGRGKQGKEYHQKQSTAWQGHQFITAQCWPDKKAVLMAQADDLMDDELPALEPEYGSPVLRWRPGQCDSCLWSLHLGRWKPRIHGPYWQARLTDQWARQRPCLSQRSQARLRKTFYVNLWLPDSPPSPAHTYTYMCKHACIHTPHTHTINNK